MRANFSLYLVILLALGVVLSMPDTVMAQDIYLKKDRGTASGSSSDEKDSGPQKLYLSPKPDNFQKKRYKSNNPAPKLYNSTGNERQREAKPSTTVNRDNELDRIQQANIDGAQARATRNAQVVKEMQKTWDAERAAADQKAREEQMAQQAAQQQASQTTSGNGSGKDLSNAKYLDKDRKDMDSPKRTFDVFR